jgi:hypothetical protein
VTYKRFGAIHELVAPVLRASRAPACPARDALAHVFGAGVGVTGAGAGEELPPPPHAESIKAETAAAVPFASVLLGRSIVEAAYPQFLRTR